MLISQSNKINYVYGIHSELKKLTVIVHGLAYLFNYKPIIDFIEKKSTRINDEAVKGKVNFI